MLPSGRDRTDHELVAGVAALERTALAWERTAISIAALGTAVFKFVEVGPLVRAAGVVLIAAAVVLVVVVVPGGYHRARKQVLASGPGVRLHRRDPVVGAVLLATACVISLAAGFAIAEALILV